MRKKLFFLAALLLGICGATAQNAPTWGPFESQPLWGNIYVGADVGAQTIWGNSKLSPMRHNVDLQIGKWWSPFLGTRIKAEMGRFKTSEHNTEFAHRQFTSFVWHADAIANWTNLLLGYKPDRFYNAKTFLGLGVIHTWGSGAANVNHESRKATQMAAFAGMTNTFRLTPALDVNLELQGAVVPKAIEGERNFGWRSHGQLSVMLGIAYKLPPRGFSGIGKADNSGLERRITQLETDLDNCGRVNQQCQQDLQRTQNALTAAQQAAATTCARNPVPGQAAASCTANDPNAMCPGGCGCKLGKCNCKGCPGAGKGCNQAPKAIYMPEMAVFFDINSAKISAREVQQLKLYADAINAACCPYTVVGYADLQTGSKAYNQQLAMKRAQAVAQMLINKYGVNPSLINAEAGNLETPPFTDEIYNRTAIIKVP